ncbi:MAG: protein kinase [Deltaproteobacteria bacterium]|nr:protein kinase [Deltaproteobacteria bacterium]
MNPTQVIKKCLPTYKVVRPLGEGVYGTVYEITDGLKDRAVKVVPLAVERSLSNPSKADLDSRISQDFHAVKEYYEKIEGPGVLKVMDFHLVGKEVTDTGAKGYLAILMELCVKNLRDHVLDQEGRLATEEAMGLMMELAGVLRRLSQECGDPFLVTDLKPSNLLFNQQEDLVIGDLGGLKRLASVSSTAKVQYTPDWSAPETILQAQRPSLATILYSFGLVSFFLWEGTLPHEEADFIERLSLVKEKGVEFSRPDVPDHIAAVIRSCLAFDPTDRPRDFEEVEEALAPKKKKRDRGKAKKTARAPVKAASTRSGGTSSRTRGAQRSRFREPASRYALCPRCARPNRVPGDRPLSRMTCQHCQGPLALSPLTVARDFFLATLVCLLGWAGAAGVQNALSARQVTLWNPAWAPGWIPGGMAVGLGLVWAIPGFSKRHAFFTFLAVSAAGVAARMPEFPGAMAWFLLWTGAALAAGAAVRMAMPRFTWDMVGAHAVAWTAFLGLALFLFLVFKTELTALLPALDLEQMPVQRALIEAMAAPAGLAATFVMARRAARPLPARERTTTAPVPPP